MSNDSIIKFSYDLFRYCLLYIKGGIYLDIKTELIKPIKDIINKNYFYTVLTGESGVIYQGIIACEPNEPIFIDLITYIVKNYKNISSYHMFIKHMRDVLVNKYVKDDLRFGLNANKYYLFEERIHRNCSHLDRYNLCSYIYDKNNKIFNTRYTDYPW